MKVREILETQQLDEINLKQAALGAMIGASTIGGGYSASIGHADEPEIVAQHVERKQKEAEQLEREREAEKRRTIASEIASKYKVEPDFVFKVIKAAEKYADPVFPTANDILAFIGVESSFDPEAKSGLSDDPAYGLMQVRPLMWDIDPDELVGDIDAQIKYGTEILKYYFKRLKNKNATIHAYNIGLRAWRRGDKAPHYKKKIDRELNDLRAMTVSL